jgi:hypothetical protein
VCAPGLLGGSRSLIQDRFSERAVRVTSIAICTACVVYFHFLDLAVFSTAHFSPIFRHLLARYDSRAAWLVFAVCLPAALGRRPAPILKLVGFIARHPIGVTMATVVALATGAIVVYHNYPLSMDEYSAVFQSKVFASRSIAANVRPDLIDWLVVRGFNGEFLIGSPQTGRIIEAYWPGFALLLAPFQVLGVGWLCNACLSGLSLYLIYWITREIAGDQHAAGWAMLFALASGAFIANGISYYSMQAHLAANLLFVALLLRPSAKRAFISGLVGSLALILHNPVPHALFASPWIVALTFSSDRRRYLVPLVTGYLPGVMIGVGWLVLRADIGSGRASLAVMNSVAAGVFAWPDAVLLNARVAAFVKMCVWAMPSLIALALWGFVLCRSDSRVRLLACSATLTFVAYMFVRFDQGHGWGYRYFHSAWGVVPILAGCAIARRAPLDPRIVSFAGASAILSLLLLMPFQISQIEGFIAEHLAQLPKAKGPGNNVYFVHPLAGFYVADMIQFDPQLRDRDLLLVSHGTALDGELVQQNWPHAVKIASTRVADQWYLGPEDQRIRMPGGSASRQFVIADIPR